MRLRLFGPAASPLSTAARRFWLGAQRDKGGRGQRNREEIGTGATIGFYFFAASPLSSASDKTAMIRRLGTGLKRYQNSKK